MDRLLRVLFFLFALLAYVNGVTYVVNTVNDVVAADGVMSLREALNAATLNVASFEAPAGSPTLNDDIILPAGTFTITGADLPILTGGPGTISGAAGLATIISGANTFRPFWVGTNSWSISSLIITNGRATGVNAQFINGTSTSGTGGGGGGGGLGGGIYISGAATLNLIGVIVQNNIAEGGNGSAGVVGPVGGVNVTGVGGNTDPLGKGVGGNGGTATLNCTAGTYASGGGGGAAGAVGCAAGTFGGAGGAGLAGASGFGGPGGGGGGLGGGIYVEGGATLSITTTSVVLNAALGGVGFLPGLGKGGGIFLEAGSTFTSTASCIQLNTAENPAGIATDNNNNFGTVPADPAPTLVLPANATVQCRTSTLPAVTGTAQPFDNCPIAPATFTDVTVTGSCPQNLIVTRTWRATDSVGQNVTGNQQILLVDTTAPVLTPPAAATIPCGTSPVPANTGGLAVAVDNCDAAPVVTFSDVTNPGLCPQAPVITRTFNATDACGNVAVPVTQTITFIDNIAPTLVIPANVSIPCTVPPTTANTGGNATATDNCDLAPVVSFTDTLVPGGCVSNFTILRTWSARDACGNVATRVQGIVVFDNIPPVLTPPANVIVGCNVVPGDNTTGAATAVDSCAAPITLTSTLVDILPCSFARNFRAVDQCGNVATATQIITVVDTTPPVITPPASTTLSCALDPTTNAGTANATDNCFRSPTPAVNFTDAVTFTGSCPGIQTITRTFRAVDVCGNIGTAVQTIAQTASAAPNITIPDDVTVGCFDPVQSGNLGVATASFFCNVGVSINSQDSITNGTCPDQFTIQRTWTVKDVCNNTNSGVQVITVDDTEAPVIVVPDDQTIDCGEFPDFEVMAMDSCSTKLTITSDDDISGDSCLEDDQTIVRTWTVTDGCGNQATGEQTININKRS